MIEVGVLFKRGREKVLKWAVPFLTTRWQKNTMDYVQWQLRTGRLAGCLCDQRSSPRHLPHPLKTFYSHRHHRRRHSPYQLPLSNFNDRSWNKHSQVWSIHTMCIYQLEIGISRFLKNYSFEYLNVINHENYTNTLNMGFFLNLICEYLKFTNSIKKCLTF